MLRPLFVDCRALGCFARSPSFVGRLSALSSALCQLLDWQPSHYRLPACKHN